MVLLRYEVFWDDTVPLCSGLQHFKDCNSFTTISYMVFTSGVPVGGGGFGVFKTPHPEILKALQNRAKLNPTVKTVKNC